MKILRLKINSAYFLNKPMMHGALEAKVNHILCPGTEYVAGCKALGLIEKYIITPLWKLVDGRMHILAMNAHYTNFILFLRQPWKMPANSGKVHTRCFQIMSNILLSPSRQIWRTNSGGHGSYWVYSKTINSQNLYLNTAQFDYNSSQWQCSNKWGICNLHIE